MPDAFQDRLGYSFRDPALLPRALTHPSWLQDHPGEVESNQRLEFLGDAVLQVILTEELFTLFPGEREGALSKRRAALAKGAFLARLARELGLPAALRLGASEEAGGGRDKAAALEDACERRPARAAREGRGRGKPQGPPAGESPAGARQRGAAL